MLYIGNHTSSSRGYLAMGKQMLANGGNTFAFFTRNPRGGKAKDIDPQDVQAFGQLAEENLTITLALSLHAPNDEKRKELMPIAYKYSLSEVFPACKYYFEKTGRRLTFEYSLVGGKNDSEEDAQRLAELIKGLNCHINLIPVNPIKERDFEQSTQNNVAAFKHILERQHIQVTVRREMGRDIQAACGQLRKSYKERSGDE